MGVLLGAYIFRFGTRSGVFHRRKAIFIKAVRENANLHPDTTEIPNRAYIGFLGEQLLNTLYPIQFLGTKFVTFFPSRNGVLTMTALLIFFPLIMLATTWRKLTPALITLVVIVTLSTALVFGVCVMHMVLRGRTVKIVKTAVELENIDSSDDEFDKDHDLLPVDGFFLVPTDGFLMRTLRFVYTASEFAEPQRNGSPESSRRRDDSEDGRHPWVRTRVTRRHDTLSDLNIDSHEGSLDASDSVLPRRPTVQRRAINTQCHTPAFDFRRHYPNSADGPTVDSWPRTRTKTQDQPYIYYRHSCSFLDHSSNSSLRHAAVAVTSSRRRVGNCLSDTRAISHTSQIKKPSNRIPIVGSPTVPKYFD